MKKIGLLGGTFDPPHFGHLLIAEQAREVCCLDEVWFMPTKIPPHKIGSNLCSDAQRIEMVKKAINSNPFFKLSLVEFERQGPSYTIETVKLLLEKHADVDFHFIIGGDMVNFLPKWKKIDELLNLITFIGMQRPGHRFKQLISEKIVMVEAPQLDISSSEIRDRLRNNKSVRYLLPEAVIDYIVEEGIYGKG